MVPDHALGLEELHIAISGFGRLGMTASEKLKPSYSMNSLLNSSKGLNSQAAFLSSSLLLYAAKVIFDVVATECMVQDCSFQLLSLINKPTDRRNRFLVLQFVGIYLSQKTQKWFYG